MAPDSRLEARLAAYFTELDRWNRRINLTGLKSMDEMVFKHLGDTLLLAQNMPKNVHTVLDIGTGAGIPGLLLKLIHPELNVVLVDAVRKKVSFLKTAIAKLNLTGVWAEHGRAGDPGVPKHMPQEGFDLITSRALGSISSLLKIALPLLSPAGTIIAMKGPGGPAELGKSMNILQKKGVKIKILEKNLPVLGHKRCLIFFQRMYLQDEA